MIGTVGNAVLSSSKVLSNDAVRSFRVRVVSRETRPPVTKTISGTYTPLALVSSSCKAISGVSHLEFPYYPALPLPCLA
jgi:hypothetical protein